MKFMMRNDQSFLIVWINVCFALAQLLSKSMSVIVVAPIDAGVWFPPNIHWQ